MRSTERARYLRLSKVASIFHRAVPAAVAGW